VGIPGSGMLTGRILFPHIFGADGASLSHLFSTCISLLGFLRQINLC
jgi:hypothetical protein